MNKLPLFTPYSEVPISPTMKISLKQLHELISDAYAVCVNDILYFVGYDTDDDPYISTNDGEDYVDLSQVDGDIIVDKS